MARAEEDVLWEERKTFAVEQQQCLHELLPDCTIYKSNERKYLKQNIGYAIYGSPEFKNAEEESSCFCKTENPNDTDVADTDVANTVSYDEKAEKVIAKIYEKICTSTEVKTDDSQPIYFGVIYNIIFPPKENIQPKKKEAKKEGEKEVKKDALSISPIPIFKIRKSVEEKSETTKRTKQENASNAVEVQYEIWYIDIFGRVYKNWTDYKENNNLPKCTMVLPKDGSYQCSDPNYPVTEEYSTVWLEIIDSPACTFQAELCNKIDIASTVVGIGTIGLSIASMFTPLAPVVMVSGLAAGGVAGAWSLGRSSQQLADRSSHEESIRVFDKEAFPHYLNIAGTVVGLGAMGGSAIISKAAARGMTINTIARVAFNTVQGGNIVLNGVGVLYQSYCMYDKYKTEETFNMGDALNLATHLMFFCGSVIKVQFASDIIKNTQGQIINDYRETLSNRRLRKKFNRTVRTAAENNICKISENAEVIRYIKRRQELLSNQSVTNNRILDNTSHNIVWSVEHGRLKVNGITLLDPIEFVTRLIKLGIFIVSNQNDSSNSQNRPNDFTADPLAKVLCDLLSKFYVSDDCPKSKKLPIVPDFEPLLNEMRSMNIKEDYLKMLFKITEKLLKRSKTMDDFLLLTFTFVWQYCKSNLKRWGMSLCYGMPSVSGSKILQKIITAVFEAIDMILEKLYDAFAKYINFYLHNRM